MKKRLVVVTVVIVALLFTALQTKNEFQSKEAFSKVTFKYGAKGNDVYELQGRLKFLGFFSGQIDGQYGYQTLKAVKYFQWKFGMKTDGMVGSKTKLKLWQATKNWKPSGNTVSAPAPAASKPKAASSSNARMLTGSSHLGLSSNDLRIMANAVHGESRGEPYEGQVAVAAVILNRLKSKSFPNTINGVIFQPGAFTAVADGQIWLTPNSVSKRAVQDALNGWDPTGGCIYYFNPETATNKWIWSRPQVKTIGKHIFCK